MSPVKDLGRLSSILWKHCRCTSLSYPEHQNELLFRMFLSRSEQKTQVRSNTAISISVECASFHTVIVECNIIQAPFHSLHFHPVAVLDIGHPNSFLCDDQSAVSVHDRIHVKAGLSHLASPEAMTRSPANDAMMASE